MWKTPFRPNQSRAPKTKKTCKQKKLVNTRNPQQETMHAIRKEELLGVCWQDKVTNADVLQRTGHQTVETIVGE